MISLTVLIVACLVGVGVLMVFYGSRRIPIPGPVQLRTNLRHADQVLALQFPAEKNVFQRLRRWLNGGGFHDVSIGEYAAVCVGNTAVVFILVRLLLGGDILAAEIALASLVVPIGYVTVNQRSREEAIEEQLDKVLSIVINLLQASGRNLRSALGDLVEEETQGETRTLSAVLPAPLGPELVRLVGELQVTNHTLAEALRSTSARVAHPAFDMFVAAATSATEGQTSQLLGHVRDHIREQRTLRSSIRAAFSLVVSQIYVLAAIPVAMLAMWRLVSPEVADLMFRSTLGQSLVVLMLAYSWLGVLVVTRQGRLANLIKGVKV
ncbi:MAG: type II secretion system F family protein [Chloroflexi bacterium]|nr:type II secretion system F family protein [Chloroflexota bacterium]